VSLQQLRAEAWRGAPVHRHTIGVTLGELRRAMAEYGSWIRHDRRAGFSLRVPPSEAAIRIGDHLLGHCSRDGFKRALEMFNEAAATAPDDHRGFAGQSNCYLLLTAFGLKPGWQVAPLFRNAHQRAIALAGPTPELRCQFAQGLLFYERHLRHARVAFERLADAESSNAAAHVGNAFVMAAAGDLDAATTATEAALAIEPLSPVAATSNLMVTVWRRDKDLAVTLGARVVELHPFFGPARIYYGMALQVIGEFTRAVEQYRTATLFMQQLPWALSLEAACLARMGRVSDARTIRDALSARRHTEYVDAYAMARIHLALGAVDDAFNELARAIDDGVGYAYTIGVDPLADGFRTDRRFPLLLRQLRGSR
jgi:Flp pilus assembly protein TadD